MVQRQIDLSHVFLWRSLNLIPSYAWTREVHTIWLNIIPVQGQGGALNKRCSRCVPSNGAMRLRFRDEVAART